MEAHAMRAAGWKIRPLNLLDRGFKPIPDCFPGCVPGIFSSDRSDVPLYQPENLLRPAIFVGPDNLLVTWDDICMGVGKRRSGIGWFC